MANIGGGVLVYGVNGQTLEGIADTAQKSYDPSEIDGKIKNHLSPIPRVSTDFIKHNDKVFPFVKVAAAESSPIIVSNLMYDEKNSLLLRPGAIYIRQNTKTIEISTAEGMRQVIERAVEYRLHETMSLFQRAANFGSEKKIELSDVEADGLFLAEKHAAMRPIEATRFVTLTRKGRPLSLKVGETAEILKTYFEIHDLGYPSPRHYSKAGNIGAGSLRYTNHQEHPVRCLSHLRSDGAFVWLSTLFEDVIAGMNGVEGTGLYKNAIGINISISYISIALCHAAFLVKALDQNEQWILRIGLRNVGNRHMILDDFNGMQAREIKTPIESNVAIERTVTLAMLENASQNIASDITKELIDRFHWLYNRPDRLKDRIDENFGRLIEGKHPT